ESATGSSAAVRRQAAKLLLVPNADRLDLQPGDPASRADLSGGLRRRARPGAGLGLGVAAIARLDLERRHRARAGAVRVLRRDPPSARHRAAAYVSGDRRARLVPVIPGATPAGQAGGLVGGLRVSVRKCTSA